MSNFDWIFSWVAIGETAREKVRREVGITLKGPMKDRVRIWS